MSLAFDTDYGPPTTHPHDPRNCDDEGWSDCSDCGGTGLLGNDTEEECPLCQGQGGWDETGEACTKTEYERRLQRAYENSLAD